MPLLLKFCVIQQTLYNFLDIGTGAGPLLFGAIVQIFSYSAAFVFTGLIFAAMIVLLAGASIIKKKKTAADTK